VQGCPSGTRHVNLSGVLNKIRKAGTKAAAAATASGTVVMQSSPPGLQLKTS